MFKAARLNIDGKLLAYAVPAVIREPELAFDAQKRHHPKGHGMICHKFLPTSLSGVIITLARFDANE
jgi:hypothetical protein